MKKFSLTVFGAAISVLVCSCNPGSQPVTQPVKGSESRKAIRAWEEQAMKELEETGSSELIGIPVVVFRNPGAGFSKAEWRKDSNGAYDMFQGLKESYGDYTEINLQVIGSPGAGPELIEAPSVISPAPPGSSGEETREWKSVYAPALKRNIRYYFLDSAFGDTNDQWATEIFTLVSADGTASSYRAEIESTDIDAVPKLFSKLGLK